MFPLIGFVDVALYIGIFVFGLTGALKARARSMDIFGALVMAFVTAYGGGTIRDLLIGIRPIGWINDDFALLLIFLSTFTTFFFGHDINKLQKVIFITDAIGLGLFTIGGLEIALQHDISKFYALVLGVISATFGGLLADIISNKVPDLLQRGELYATASAIGGFIFLLLDYTNLSFGARLMVAVLLVVIIRIVSKKKEIMLPNI